MGSAEHYGKTTMMHVFRSFGSFVRLLVCRDRSQIGILTRHNYNVWAYKMYVSYTHKNKNNNNNNENNNNNNNDIRTTHDWRAKEEWTERRQNIKRIERCERTSVFEPKTKFGLAQSKRNWMQTDKHVRKMMFLQKWWNSHNTHTHTRTRAHPFLCMPAVLCLHFRLLRK